MLFAIPMRWHELKGHEEYIRFVCQNKNVFKLSKQNRNNFVYTAVPSALFPVLHSNELPVPVLPCRSPGFVSDGTTCA